jgi:hypothetical protein
MLFVVGFAAIAAALPEAPEIDPTSGTNALALVAGALVMLRSRRKK